MLAFIWAQDQTGLIGQAGHLPWHLPADLHYFQQTTLHKTIVMGRKTFMSFPYGALPQRRNIVLTHQAISWPQVEIIHQPTVLCSLVSFKEPIFIIGGRQVFAEFIDQVQYLYVTQIHHTFAGATYMIPIDYRQFALVSHHQGVVDTANPWPHDFLIYQRRS